MRTKKNNSKKKNIYNLRGTSKSRKNIKIKKKIKKKSRKVKYWQKGGSSLNPASLVGKIISVTNQESKYRGMKAEILDYKPGGENPPYKCQLLNLPRTSVFQNVFFLKEEDFALEENTFDTIESNSSNKKVYVLWVVNCNSCKLSTIPHCSSDGIYDTYHYYNSLNDFYTKFENLVNSQLRVRFYCSILLRAQETAKIIIKGIRDSKPELYDKIEQEGITIMNYCQEIQNFSTSLGKIIENASFLNKLIPGVVDINLSNILGRTNSPDIKMIDEQLKTPQIEQKPDEAQTETPSVNSKSTLDDPATYKKNSDNQSEILDNETEVDNKNGDQKKEGTSTFSFFKNFGNKNKDEATSLERVDEPKTTPINVENQILTPESDLSKEQDGGFFNFLNGLFSSSSPKREESEFKEQPNTSSVSFRTQNDDYKNWKERVLPALNEKHLNIVISHGYYIKKHVLNNNSRSRINNLDGFLLEYNFDSSNQLTKINFLGESLLENELFSKNEIGITPENKNIRPTISAHLQKTSNLWKKITEESQIEGKEKYSRCFLK